MKILSNKEYHRLVNKIDTLTKDNDCMNRKLDEMKEDKPNDCKSNEGSHFCNICEFGYLRARNLIGTDIYACSKTVPCEDFKRKEVEE